MNKKPIETFAFSPMTQHPMYLIELSVCDFISRTNFAVKVIDVSGSFFLKKDLECTSAKKVTDISGNV